MDNQAVSKEALAYTLREVICNINRNLYEWTTGSKKGKIQFTITYSEVKGLVRNWLIRSLRDKIGYIEADRIFKGLSISVDADNSSIKHISLSTEGRRCHMYQTVLDVMSSLNFETMKYNPKDFIMDRSMRKDFDPFFYISFDEIKSITF